MTMTKPTSEQVTFTAAGSGATLRNLVDKVREVVSVKDFGAVGDGIANDTAAIQAALNAAIAANRALYIPGGTYNITSLTYQLTAVTGNGILIYGDAAGNTYGTRGSILKAIGTSGNMFTITSSGGGAGANYCEFRNLTFTGNSQIDAGLAFDQSWFGKIIDCHFVSFLKANGRAIWLYANPAYAGTTFITACTFGSNSIGILSSGVSLTSSVNAVHVDKCWFLDHTEAGIQVGTSTVDAFQARNHNITSCGFEGCVIDILCYASMYQMSVEGCYFENYTVTANPCIQILQSSSPGSECVSICNNYFARSTDAGLSLIDCYSRHVTVLSNQHDSPGGQDRFFVSVSGTESAKIEPAAAVPGLTPCPIRNKNYIASSYTSYTYGIDTSTRPPLTAVTYSASMALDISAGGVLTITPTNSSAFTISNVMADAINLTNRPQLFTVCIVNTTGGALGTATWSSGAGGFKLGAAWTQPATGNRRYITFIFDPSANRAYEISRSAADVAN